MTPLAKKKFSAMCGTAQTPDLAEPKLRRYQAQAIGLALAGKTFVVTTGTGSG